MQQLCRHYTNNSGVNGHLELPVVRVPHCDMLSHTSPNEQLIIVMHSFPPTAKYTVSFSFHLIPPPPHIVSSKPTRGSFRTQPPPPPHNPAAATIVDCFRTAASNIWVSFPRQTDFQNVSDYLIWTHPLFTVLSCFDSGSGSIESAG